MKVLVTGADGFLGKNLCVVLGERGHVVLRATRATPAAEFDAMLRAADAVVHLAGVNRPLDPAEFGPGNAGFTGRVVAGLAGRDVPVLFASSIQAERDNDYGRSKREAEAHLERHAGPVAIYRLPNVFGKWSRPDYNSAVATFCHNTARGLPLEIHDPSAPVRLAYVDDVVAAFAARLAQPWTGVLRPRVEPEYTATVGELAATIQGFPRVRDTLIIDRVGTGLTRALYATYVSFLPTEAFAYPVPRHGDARGVFVEMLKTRDSGQFSFFTAHPGITRGGHYHHSKTEKFLVIAGHARFRFRHLLDGRVHELETRGEEPVVVETVPGWAHDITNLGSGEMVVMLWANENFDRARPDTVAAPL